MKYLNLILLFVILILSSCSPAKYSSIYIEKGLEEEFSEIAENTSFHENMGKYFILLSETDKKFEKAERKNNILKIRITSDYSYNETEKTENTLSAVIKREIHIPVTDFRDTETNADRKNISEGKYKTDIPENIYLPVKGLSFEGYYPDSEKYSLFRESRITVLIPEHTSEDCKLFLSNWINEIDIDREVIKKGKIKNEPLNKQISKTPGKNTTEAETADDKVSDKKEKTDLIVWLGAVGDIMPGRGVQDILIGRNNGGERIFSDILPILQGFDFLMGNLEGPVTYHKTVIEKAYNFKFRHKVLSELKKSGFDYLSAVNNHCFDYEEQGFADTLYYFDKYDISTSGAGLNIEEALKPAVFQKHGQNFSIIALADYPAEKDKFEGKKETEAGAEKAGILWPSEKLFDTVIEMSEQDVISIASVHGGYEWQNQPAENQKKLYRKLADLGADIIIGSHPHVLQPVEVYNKSLIVYSLGNFIFPGMDETEFGEESMILSIGFYKGRPLFIKYIPVNIDGKYLSLDKSGRILKRFENLNSDFMN